MFRKKKPSDASSQIEISAPELQPVGAVHPSLHGFGTLGRAGKLGSGAMVIESRPAEPAVDPGDLILPGKQDDADTKWQLFKLKQTERTLSRQKKVPDDYSRPTNTSETDLDALLEVAFSPPPANLATQIRLRAAANSAVSHASQDWAVAQNDKLDAEARLRSLEGNQADASLGGAPAVQASQDWAIAAHEEMYAEAKLVKLQGKAGGGGGSQKIFSVGPSEATAAELSASMDDARTAKTMSFVMDSDGNLSEGPSESNSDNTLPRGGGRIGSPPEPPPMSPTSPSKTSSAPSSPRRSGSLARRSSKKKKGKSKPAIDRSMISGPSDFIHLEHKNDNDIDLAALPPLSVIPPAASAEPERSPEPRRSIRRKSPEKPRPEKLRPEISAPVGFMHLEHHAAPEEAMFEDDMMLAGTRSSMALTEPEYDELHTFLPTADNWTPVSPGAEGVPTAVSPGGSWETAVPAPVISLVPFTKGSNDLGSRRGLSGTSVSVQITCEPMPAAKIRYTRNGTDVRATGQIYYGNNPPMVVPPKADAEPIVIQAQATCDGLEPSAVVTKELTLEMIWEALADANTKPRTGTFGRRSSKKKKEKERKGSVSKLAISGPSGFLHLEHRAGPTETALGENSSGLLRGSVSLLDNDYQDINVDGDGEVRVADPAAAVLDIGSGEPGGAWGADPTGADEASQWPTLDMSMPAVPTGLDHDEDWGTGGGAGAEWGDPTPAEVWPGLERHTKTEASPASALSSTATGPAMSAKIHYDSSQPDMVDYNNAEANTPMYAQVQKQPSRQTASSEDGLTGFGDLHDEAVPVESLRSMKISAAETGIGALLKMQAEGPGASVHLFAKPAQAAPLPPAVASPKANRPKMPEPATKHPPRARTRPGAAGGAAPQWLLKGVDRAALKLLAGHLVKNGESGNFFVRDGVQSVRGGHGLSVKVGNGLKKLLIEQNEASSEYTVRGCTDHFASIPALVDHFTVEVHPTLGVALQFWEVPKITTYQGLPAIVASAPTGAVRKKNYPKNYSKAPEPGASARPTGARRAGAAGGSGKRRARKLPVPPGKSAGANSARPVTSPGGGAQQQHNSRGINALTDRVATKIQEKTAAATHENKLDRIADKIADRIIAHKGGPAAVAAAVAGTGAASTAKAPTEAGMAAVFLQQQMSAADRGEGVLRGKR